MAETRTFELHEYQKLADPNGGIVGIKTYRNTIPPFLRSMSYDALMCLEPDPESPGMVKRDNYHTAVCNRIAAGKLDMQAIIPSYILEKTHGGSDSALNAQVRGLRYLARLVWGGMNVRIATPDANDTRLLNAGSFALVRYEGNRPSELTVATSAGDLVMAKEGEGIAYSNVEAGFDMVWEDPATIGAMHGVRDYLHDAADRLEARIEN